MGDNWLRYVSIVVNTTQKENLFKTLPRLSVYYDELMKVLPRLLIVQDQLAQVTPRYLQQIDMIYSVAGKYTKFFDVLFRTQPTFKVYADIAFKTLPRFKVTSEQLISYNPPFTGRTWLMADTIESYWSQNIGVGSLFLHQSGPSQNYLNGITSGSSWLQTEDGKPDFNTEGKEKYI